MRRNATRSDLIVALAIQGLTTREISEKLGITQRSVQRILQARADDLQALQRERLQALTNALGERATRALHELDRLLRDPLCPYGVRLGAARLALETYANYLKLADLEARIRILEDLAGIGGDR